MRRAALARAPCAVAVPSGPYSLAFESIQIALGCMRITWSAVCSDAVAIGSSGLRDTAALAAVAEEDDEGLKVDQLLALAGARGVVV